MENNNYLIIIAINFGENFPINDLKPAFGHYCDTCAVIEARFNDTVLTSDAIKVSTTDPELNTELCFQLDRKQLHLYRIERKSIKLQAFLVNPESTDRQFIGYTVIDLRNAKTYSNAPKYEWKTLLNPKYKGTSSRRPQMSIALMINKLDDNSIDGHLSDRQLISDNESISSQMSGSTAFGRNSGQDIEISGNKADFVDESDVENDLKIRFRNGFHHIWDEKRFNESDCKLRNVFSVTIAFAENMRKLFVNSQQIQNSKPFHFRYTFLGTTVKTKPFSDIDSCDFEIERMAFNILTTDKHTLSLYFQLNPNIEIQFCDNTDLLYGFVAISLTQFVNKTQTVFRPIEGSFVLLADNETLDICDPFPIVGVSIELRRSDNTIDSPKVFEVNGNHTTSPTTGRVKSRNPIKQKSIETQESIGFGLNHYCFAIDLRFIRVIDEDIPQITSCYLQFLYAFFGFTENIKTFPSIQLKANEEVVIPHGFCAFNFATNQQKLEKTFKEIPLIIEVIEETTIHTIIGTAKVNLSKILETKPNRADAKQVINLMVPVINEMDKTWAQIQIIMFLQNYGKTQIPLSSDGPEVSVMKGMNSFCGDSQKEMKELDELMVETALEIELWKEKQLILFRERLKQNETQYMEEFEEKRIQREEELKNKLQELSELEAKLLSSLNELKERENNIVLKENEIEIKQKEINSRYERLNEEISEVMADLKDNYEQRLTAEKNKLKEVESEKCKFQERVYALERKLKERENKIKEIEEKVSETNKTNVKRNAPKGAPNNQKSTSVKTITRNTTTTPKTVVVTRDPVVSAQPLTTKPTKSPIFTKTSTLKANLKPVISNNTKNMTNNTTNKGKAINESQTKSKLIETIRRKRRELIDGGVALNDPIIKEIDSKLKSI